LRAAYVDEDVLKAGSRLLSDLGHDSVHTEESGNKGQTDVQQLVFAVSNHRLFITANRRDFEPLHEAWLACARLWGVTGRLDDGILIVPNGREMDPQSLATAIDAFLRSGVETENRLFRMDRSGNWREETA
jgi:hypothetical protein